MLPIAESRAPLPFVATKRPQVDLFGDQLQVTCHLEPIYEPIGQPQATPTQEPATAVSGRSSAVSPAIGHSPPEPEVFLRVNLENALKVFFLIFSLNAFLFQALEGAQEHHVTNQLTLLPLNGSLPEEPFPAFNATSGASLCTSGHVLLLREAVERRRVWRPLGALFAHVGGLLVFWICFNWFCFVLIQRLIAFNCLNRFN